jgi:hypothetical protein
MARRRPTARFTLLEVIIAVTLLLLIVVALVSFGREMARSWEKLRGEHARFRALLTLDRALDGLLSNAVPFTWPNEDGEAVPFFVGEPEYLRLVSLHPVTQADEGALRFAEMFVRDGLLEVAYTVRPYREVIEDSEQVRTTVLATGVERVEFAYADWSGDESGDWGNRLLWVDEWDVERQELPLAVMMTVHWDDGRVESWLRRLASGYRERWGKWEPAKNKE